MKAISRIAPGNPIQSGSSIAHPLWVEALRSTVPDDAKHRRRHAAPRPGRETYSFFPIATAVSAMRLEKPHSLSYQDITRTSVPF